MTWTRSWRGWSWGDGIFGGSGLEPLLHELGTVAYNITSTSLNPNAKIVITTRPTPIQAKAFKLLDVNHACSQ